MSDNKLVKTVLDAATLTGFAAGIGWAAKKAFNKMLLERQIDKLCSLIKQVMEDKRKMIQALEDGEVNRELKIKQELKKYNIIEQMENIFSESDKNKKILKDFDYNQLEYEIKLKLKLIENFFLENTLFYFILNI